ncbi:unnamed protein product [Mytilus edulis]|uniref:Ig-like domain-containing protein n=1 Tax=Mytilus edulis TaxID=6550 RepID=A0A8S3PQD9_MYTED|nr:unnamed protein product [Mytilus edulis]
MPRRRNEYRRRLRPRVNDVQQPAPHEEPAPEEEPVPEEVVQVVNRGRRGNRRRAAPEHQQPDQPVEHINQPPPQKQLKTTAVQAGPGNTLINTGPLLMPCANEVDIIVSQQIKEKNWNFEYVDFALSCVRFDRLQGNQGFQFGSLRPPMFNQNRPQMSNQFRQNRPSFVQQNRYRPPFNTRFLGTEALYTLKGSTVQLKCKYTADAGLKQHLLWKKGNTLLSENTIMGNTDVKERLSITGKHSLGEYHLSISDIRESDQATYSCSITRTTKVDSQQLIVYSEYKNVSLI